MEVSFLLLEVVAMSLMAVMMCRIQEWATVLLKKKR